MKVESTKINILFDYKNYSGGSRKEDYGSIDIDLKTELMAIKPSSSDSSIYPSSAIRIETDPLNITLTEIMRIMSDLFGRDIDTDHEAPLFCRG